jgi:hypothetical protein
VIPIPSGDDDVPARARLPFAHRLLGFAIVVLLVAGVVAASAKRIVDVPAHESLAPIAGPSLSDGDDPSLAEPTPADRTEQPFIASQDGFSASFGGTPRRSVQHIERPGFSGEFIAYTYASNDEALALMVLPIPGRLDLSKWARATASALPSKGIGTVASELDATFHGVPAKDLIVLTDGSYLRVRITVLDHRAWVFAGEVPSSDSPHGSYDRLLDTFTLLGAASTS